MQFFQPPATTAAAVIALIDSNRPQATAALTVTGSGDSLAAAPTWSAASVLTASPAGNIAIDVAGLADGAVGKLRLTPANAKTVTFSATGGTIAMQGGEDLNPITGDGTKVWSAHVTRQGTIYDVTIIEIGAYT